MDSADEFEVPEGPVKSAICVPTNIHECSLTRDFVYEVQHPDVVRSLRASGLIPREADDNPDKTPRRSHYKAEPPLLVYEKYVKSMDKDGFVKVRFLPSSRAVRKDRFWGRVYGPGMATLTRKIKHTLSRPCPAIGWEGYYDIDIKNCHPTILREALRSDPEVAPASYKYLSEFVDNRPVHLAAVEAVYGVDTDSAKSLFLSLFFGGSSAGWFRQKRDTMTRPNPSLEAMPMIVSSLERELATHIAYLIRHNKAFFNTCEKYEQNCARRDPSHFKNSKGRFLSLWSQTKELQIVSSVIEALLQTPATLVRGKRVFVYEYDAIKLNRGAVNSFMREKGWQMADFLSYISTIVVARFNMEITFCAKDCNDGYDISEAIASQPGESDEVAYDNIRQFMKELRNPDRATPDKLAFNTHSAVASFVIHIRFPGVFIYFKDEWYCWDDERGGWECYHHWGRPVNRLDRAITSVSTYLSERAEELVMSIGLTMTDFEDCSDWGEEEWTIRGFQKPAADCVIKFKKELNRVQMNLGCHTFHQGVVAFCRTEAAVSELRFNRDPYLLGFPNGCFDFNPAEPVFRPFIKEDFVTMRCGIPYDESVPENREKLLMLLARIFPDPEVRDYALAVLGTALLGVPVENLFVFNGAGRNGKGLLDETMATLLGIDVRDGYCAPSLNPALLCAAIESNKPYPEIVDLECKRFVVSKEPPSGKKLNNATIRGLTGGQGITARRLHANTEPVTIHATWVLECNEKPPFQETPMMADMKRISNVPFESIFTEVPSEVKEDQNWYLCDPELKSDANKRLLAVELFHILVPYARQFISNNCKMPQPPTRIVHLTLEYVMDSFLAKKAFEELYYDLNENPPVTICPCDEILARIKEADFFQEYNTAEKRAFKKDNFGKNLADVFKLTYGAHRVVSTPHPRTGKPTFSVLGFGFVGDP